MLEKFGRPPVGEYCGTIINSNLTLSQAAHKWPVFL